MCHDLFMYVPWLLHIHDERYEKPSLGSSAAESCRIFMSHVTYKWVMSRMNFSCLCIHMRHVTSYVWHESCNFICVTWHAILWVPQQHLLLPPLVLRHVADTWDMSRMSTCHERRRSTRHVTYDMSRMSHLEHLKNVSCICNMPHVTYATDTSAAVQEPRHVWASHVIEKMPLTYH